MTDILNPNSNDKQDTSITGTVDSSTSIAPKSGTFTALSIPGFRWLLTGSFFTYAIQWVQSVILSWLVYDITRSGTILGTMNLVSSIASFIMIFATGVLVDYFNRRKMMLIETGTMLVVTLALGTLLVTGHTNIVYLFIYTFIFGLVQTLDSTLRQVLIFDIVPRSQTPNAMALNQTGWSIMRVAGPSIGGFFLLWFGAGGSFLTQAGIWVLIALAIIRMKIPDRTTPPVRSNPFQNMKDSLGYIFSERITRTFTLIGIIMPIVIIPIFATLPPIYAVQVFGDTSGRVLGFLMAAVGVGGVIGGVAITYLRRLEHWGRIQMTSGFLLSITLLGFAYTSNLAVAMVLLALAGISEIIFLTTNMTLIQLSIPNKIRGRVTAAVNLTWILSPIGSLIAGTGADLIGPKEITIILSVIGAVLVVLIYLFSPTVRNYRLSQGIETK